MRALTFSEVKGAILVAIVASQLVAFSTAEYAGA